MPDWNKYTPPIYDKVYAEAKAWREDMNQEILDKAKALFDKALCGSGMTKDSFNIAFDSTLIDEEDYYSFLLSVTVSPFNTDEGLCKPEPVIFQVDYQRYDGEISFIVGEDTETEITYGNVFAYMYFSTIEPKAR